ncbi:MAG: chromate transporter [Ruminococcaceae bacterium]|nr:chromate transporter [Oscillospiraceae bacterium]
MKKYLSLFLSFFKIGLFTFGGGYAMISLLENEFVERKRWIDHEEFMNVVVIAESTPGPIAINSATYIGYRVGGIPGSLLATLGICIPSFTIIFLISLFFDRFIEMKLVAAAFKGIQVCVIYLILSAGIKMLKKMKKQVFTVCLTSATAILMILLTLFSLSFSTIFYIIAGGALGIFYYLCTDKLKKGEKL